MMLKINKPLVFATLACITGIIFLIYPQLDIIISSWFYREEDKFFLDTHPIFEYIHESVRILTICLLSLWVVLLIRNILGKSDILQLSRKKLIYLILALLLGPGLVVNTIFKDNWGRARPEAIQQFGGAKEFTPPFIIAGQCERNCSFVSGDPSVGFYFFALALAIPAYRKLFFRTSLYLGGIYGITRIVQGAHFTSDVIFSGVFTIATCYLLYLAMFRKETNIASTVKS
ncbi:MAG: (acid phosphatase) superfamily protein [Rickettsiaceae bacterium]|jgi:lipid A 4'-phosphatase|nr:(acid phosphatase) superfamily protein [Rickettsiaceae bacterium]